jgi:hypothetical protein
MTTSSGIRARSGKHHRPSRGGWFIALQLVAWASLALFVLLHRDPLPDEVLAAYAAGWVDISEAVE